MPVSPTYPGVYVEEIPSGIRTIVGASTSIAAFVGYTERGPSNTPVRIFNFGDYERAFGGLARDSQVSYAVQQFYINGGGEAYVVRVAAGAQPAQLSLKDRQGNIVLTATAANDGKWGNALALEVDYGTQNPDSSFNLTVIEYGTQNGKRVSLQQEKYLNLEMSERAERYAPSVVNSSSKLVRLERANSITFDQSGYSLSGKLEDFPALESETTQLSGWLDGSQRFDLLLTAPLPTDFDSLISKLTEAITANGLDGRLQVQRANALGVSNASGNYVKFTSASTSEQSAVTFVRAASNDASGILKLGRSSQGREVTGASNRRPAATGTTSGDLAAISSNNLSGTIKFSIKNPATPEVVFPEYTIALNFSEAVTLQKVRDELQEKIRGVAEATRNVTVRIYGTYLNVRASPEIAASVVEFTAIPPNATSGPTDLINFLNLADNDAEFNVAQYSLGVGKNVAFQQDAVLGHDGLPPGANELIGSEKKKQGIYALSTVDQFNLLLVPRTSKLNKDEASAVVARAESFCEKKRAFLLVDPPSTETMKTISDWAQQATKSQNAGLFFPQVMVPDPLDGLRPRAMPASGSIAGVMARIDGQRGIWKAPAGVEASVNNILGPAQVLTDDENGTLNPLGINCIRKFPVYGSVVWGARTRRGADAFADEYKYIPVRRLALHIEESLFRGLKWVVFEPNDEPLWAQIRLNVGAFMQNLFRQGAFQGSTPREAYLVKCDRETTTQNDINLGIVNVVVGFAPLKPAEFVIIKLQQLAGQIQV